MSSFESLGIVGLKIGAGGQQKVLCPKCSALRKNKHDKCLSVDVDKQMGHCHNCDWSFTLWRKEYVKIFVRPAQVPELKLSDKTLKWFANRKISKETLHVFKVGEEKQWMPERIVEGKKHEAGERNCICFNYFKDNALINIKYRDALKNFRMVKDAELIPYNLDFIKGNAECVICEGEIDAMSFFEAGIKNVVSVPNGASKGAKLDYLNTCFEYFENMNKIFIATDGDETGMALQKELTRRLGSHKCYTVTYPESCKDANEVLVKYGDRAVKELITGAAAVPIDGVYVIDKSSEAINDIFLHGYPTALASGFTELDNYIKWRRGDFTIITGVPNHGKSNWVDQIMVRLAIKHDWKFGIFSPENQPIELHIIKLLEIFVGKAFYRYDDIKTMTALIKDVALDILSDCFYFMKIEEIDITIDGILSKAAEMVGRYGIDGLVIDPYNCIEHQIPNGYSETRYISELLEKICRFKLKYNVHVFLIAHPVKMKKQPAGNYEVPGLYDISGSSHFYNKPDNGITIYRNSDDSVDAHIQKVRHKWIGKKGIVKFTYDVITGRYAEIGTNYSSDFEWLRRKAQNEMFTEEEQMPIKRLNVPEKRGRYGDTTDMPF